MHQTLITLHSLLYIRYYTLFNLFLRRQTTVKTVRNLHSISGPILFDLRTWPKASNTNLYQVLYILHSSLCSRGDQPTEGRRQTLFNLYQILYTLHFVLEAISRLKGGVKHSSFFNLYPIPHTLFLRRSAD
jgi:hypothetical protein